MRPSVACVEKFSFRLSGLCGTLSAMQQCVSMREEMVKLARQGRVASRQLNRLSTEMKNQCLHAMADALLRDQALIREENVKDLADGKEAGLSAAMLDRLDLTPKRFEAMANGLREVAELPDPVGHVIEERQRPNGLLLKKVATPIGVIAIIYESRPNVTADAAGLCFKAGNATILRGGKEALHSNQAIARTLIAAARAAWPDFPEHAIQVVPTTDREAIPILLAQTESIDLCIPRGGEGLIRAVAECSRIPVIKHYKGVCHVYTDKDADLAMAQAIVVNSKTQRPGVCNAAETWLVDKDCDAMMVLKVAQALVSAGVRLRVDESTADCLRAGAIQGFEMATEADWDEEYLDLILSVRMVDGVQGAIEHIAQHGSGHSEAIVTASEATAQTFLNEVDASAVYWNTSTRFTDGAEFGMGAEIGISTDKIGARGPMGLPELTTYKWIGTSNGLIRE